MRKGKNEKWSRGGHRRHLAHLQRGGGVWRRRSRRRGGRLRSGREKETEREREKEGGGGGKKAKVMQLGQSRGHGEGGKDGGQGE